MVCRRNVQFEVRSKKACHVAACLVGRINVDLALKTGDLFPRGSLKRKNVRHAFSWMSEMQGRVFTTRFSRMVVKKIMRSIQFHPPLDMDVWVKAQADRLQKLARSVKKGTRAMADDTCPMLPEEADCMAAPCIHDAYMQVLHIYIYIHTSSIVFAARFKAEIARKASIIEIYTHACMHAWHMV